MSSVPAHDDPQTGFSGGAPSAVGGSPLIEGVFETADVGLILLDASGTVLRANAAVLRDLGHQSADLVGEHISRVLPGCQDARGQYGGPIAHLARHDRVTGCLNRFGIEEHLDQLIESCPLGHIGIAYLDLSCLATAADSYPSPVSVGLVAQAVTRLRGGLREQDRLGRVGRHEFVAVVPGSDELDVSIAIEHLRACLEAPLEVAGWRVPVRASVGISLYPGHGSTPDRLFDRAEAAMRRAKRSATHAPQLYSHEDQRRDDARDEQLERIRAAAERHEFQVFYQPQFDLETLQVTGLEALLRWQHPEEGIVGPDQFLPLISECRLMPTITRWVLQQAAAFNAGLLAEGALDVPVAVNVGPELFEDRGFVDLVSQILDESGLAAYRLEVEIIEATAITAPAQVAANARALCDLGVGVSIDDFGTGFSSLRRLRLAKFSKLKIDRTYVALLPGDGRDQQVIGGLLSLAAGLDMEAVAEGIETEEQLNALRMLGCRYGQGYWYGRPMPEDDLRAWIGRQR